MSRKQTRLSLQYCGFNEFLRLELATASTLPTVLGIQLQVSSSSNTITSGTSGTPMIYPPSAYTYYPTHTTLPIPYPIPISTHYRERTSRY